MSNSLICPIDRTVSDAIFSGQSWPGSDGSEGIIYIAQSSSILERHYQIV